VSDNLRAFAGVWVVLAAGLSLTALAGWSSAAWVAGSARQRFETEAQRIHQELDGYFERLVSVMQLIRVGAQTQSHTGKADWDWRLDSVPLGVDFPAVTFTGIAELTWREDRAAQEARWQQEYGGGFHHHPDLPVARRNPHLESLTNGVLPLIYYRQGRLNSWLPQSTNGDLGRDLAAITAGSHSHDIQASQLTAATDRLPHSLFPSLFQAETAGEAPRRLPIALPIKWHDAEPSRGRQRGLLICAVDMARLFQGAFAERPPNFGLRIVFSEPEGTVLVPIYETRETWPQTAETLSPWFRTEDEVPLYFNRLHFDFWTTLEFERNNYRHAPWLVVLAGLSFTLLSAGFVAVQIRARLSQAKIAGELRVSNTQLAVATRERTRLSRDLHDGTIQSLYALGLELTHAKTLLPGNPTQAETELGHSLSALQAVVNELRQFVLELEPEMFQGQTVRTALEQLVARLRRTTPLQFHLDIAPEADAMPPKAAIHVLNLVREALSNTLRHAKALNVVVELQGEPSRWRLVVCDDGCGFDPTATPGRGGRGLRGFEERSAELGGSCLISLVPGGGTRIQVEFPRTPEKNAP
jgi:signal transduction histidine kinase/type IV secretory pathway VirB2 component (pilin)